MDRQIVMRGACAVSVLIALSACAPSRRPLGARSHSTAHRLADAESLLRAGCLDCLLAAYREYDALRSLPGVAETATVDAMRSAILIALRERELGMSDDGYLATAQGLMVGQPNLPQWLTGLFEIVEALPTSSGPPSTDQELRRRQTVRRHADAWRAQLRQAADADPVAAYTWLSFACDAQDERTVPATEILPPVASFRDIPLVRFKQAICRGANPDALRALQAGDARFADVDGPLGLSAVAHARLDEADAAFARAYAWHPRWPHVTREIADVAMTAEDYARALEFYDKTLALQPDRPDVLLGRVRALTYLGRYEDGIATVDRLLAAQWYIGDARYWRALDEAQLGRNDAAWSDIEEAAKLLVNADVPKLAGIIAYRRRQLEVSRAKFEESRGRNPNDCETQFYLGLVLSEQRDWPAAVETLVHAATCLADSERALTAEIARLRASSEPPERTARQIVRREQQIASGRRMLATSWFNTAVACYNLSRTEDARQYAEKVIDDEQFGARAKELLSRLQ